MAPQTPTDILQPRLPHVGSDLYVQDPLLKSLTSPEMPTGIKHRIIPALDQLGHYRGVQEPRRRTAITFDVLHAMSRTHIIRAIINFLIRAAQRYGRRPRRKGDYGFRIELTDVDATMTAEDRAEAAELTRFIEQGGWPYIRVVDGQIARWDGRAEEHAPRFYQLLGMLVEDSLIFDGAAVRMESPNDPEQHPIYQKWPEAREFGSPHPPVWFAPVSGRRLRRAEQTYHNRQQAEEAAGGPLVPATQEYEAEIRPELGKHVAWVELGRRGEVQREFAHNEIGYFVRNLSSDSWTDGYGRSELEYLVEIVTGLATGVSFNVEYFTRNHVPDGILSLKGEWKRESIEKFQADMVTQVGGPGKYHRLPVLFNPDGGTDAAFISTRNESRLDMYWKEWITFALNVACSMFGTPPEAIGFASYRGTGNALNEADPATRLAYGEDVCLIPLLLALEAWINETLIWPIDSRFCLRFANLRERDETKQWELVRQKLESGYYTRNEARAELGDPELRLPLDRGLWRMIERKAIEQYPALRDDTQDRERFVGQLYEQLGGEFSLAPDAPGDIASQIYMQEFGQQPGADMGMGMDAFGPGGDPGLGALGGSPEAGMPLAGGDPLGPDTDEYDDFEGLPPELMQAFDPPSPDDLHKAIPAMVTQAEALPVEEEYRLWSGLLGRLNGWGRWVSERLAKSVRRAISSAGADER